MVVAIKEHVLIGIMQQSLKCRYRLAFKARQCRFRVSSVSALTSRTAGYGPVRPVVWEGGAVRLFPIPIGILFSWCPQVVLESTALITVFTENARISIFW